MTNRRQQERERKERLEKVQVGHDQAVADADETIAFLQRIRARIARRVRSNGIIPSAAAVVAACAVFIFSFPVFAAPDGGIDGGAATSAGNELVTMDLPDPEGDPVGFILVLYQHAKNSEWGVVAAALVIAIVFVIRKWGLKIKALSPKWLGWISFFETPRGGVVLALLIGVAGGLGHALLAGAEMDLELIIAGLRNGATAIGGYIGIRRLLGIKNGPDLKAVTS